MDKLIKGDSLLSLVVFKLSVDLFLGVSWANYHFSFDQWTLVNFILVVVIILYIIIIGDWLWLVSLGTLPSREGNTS